MVMRSVEPKKCPDLTRVGTRSRGPEASNTSGVKSKHKIFDSRRDRVTFFVLDDLWTIELWRDTSADDSRRQECCAPCLTDWQT